MGEDFWESVEALQRYGEAGGRARGGPRSRLVDAILVLLLSKPMRASEIGGFLGYEAKYISSYLSYWRVRGYVDYEGGLWFLTPLGESYARSVVERESRERFSEFLSIAHKLVSESIRGARKHKRAWEPRQGEGELLSFIAGLKDKPGNKLQERVRRASCVLGRLRGEIDEEEMEIMGALLSHYSRWGASYLYLDQLMERMGADYNWLVKNLRSLQSKGLVYIYTDPRLGIRVGLSKALKALLEECS